MSRIEFLIVILPTFAMLIYLACEIDKLDDKLKKLNSKEKK